MRSFEVKESAALGAAIRAAHALLNARNRSVGWSDLFESVGRPQVKEILQPAAEAVEIYHGPEGLLNRYKACEKSALL
ncbi:MAG: hypothetical protein MUC98_07760 [Desulfobacterota bacterium]|nr:hypothetical protein [Thermodesulfobacteriota bacterium]